MHAEMKRTVRMTAAEYWLHAPPGPSELIDGKVVQLSPAGFRHGEIAGRIAKRLSIVVDERRLGIVVTSEAGFLLSRSPDTVRAPDVAFVSAARIPAEGSPSGYFPGAPDLAVEVVSPSDRWSEIEEKVERYRTAGAREIWVVDPETRVVHVHAGATIRLLDGTATLSTELLPGLMLTLAELFA